MSGVLLVMRMMWKRKMMIMSPSSLKRVCVWGRGKLVLGEGRSRGALHLGSMFFEQVKESVVEDDQI